MTYQPHQSEDLSMKPVAGNTESTPALKPCPFCAVSLTPNNNPADSYVARYGTHYMHPPGDCVLADWEISPSNVESWNRRAALSSHPANSGDVVALGGEKGEATEEGFKSAVDQAVQMARQLYGEPSYTYHAKDVRYSSRSREHMSVIGNGPEISQADYEANVAKGKADHMDAFMGRMKRSYVRYEKHQVAPAWREKLIEAIPKYEGGK